MARLIFDIETVGEDWNALDEATQENLTRWIKKEFGDSEEFEGALEELKNGLGFSPLTGEIVAIGVLDYDRDEGVVYYQAPGEKLEPTTEEGITFKPMSEKEMLKSFWEGAKKYDEFVSFNGRGFDAPFLAIRSAIHKIRPTQDLMEGRYLLSDLQRDRYSRKSASGIARRVLSDRSLFPNAIWRENDTRFDKGATVATAIYGTDLGWVEVFRSRPDVSSPLRVRL